MHIHVPAEYERTSANSHGISGTNLSFRHVGSYFVLDVDGPLATRWVGDELRAEVRHVLEAGRKNLILDLSDAPVADSAGVGALVAVREMIRAAGGKLVIYSAQRRVLEMLKRLRLDPFFTFSDDPTFAFAKS
jgi:anti-anti-sigma factor